MNSPEEERKKTIKRMRQSLKAVPIISKNVDKVRMKLSQKELAQNHEDDNISSGCTTDDCQKQENHSDPIDMFHKMYVLGRKIGEGANGLIR